MNNSECLEVKENAIKNEDGPSRSLEKTKEVKNNESGGQNNVSTKVDESDEDVPGDFFDDFLKEDFMAGLDIVDDDEWDEDKIKNDMEAPEKSKKDARKDVDAAPPDNRQKENLKKKKKLSSKDGDVKKSGGKDRRSKQKKKKHDEKGDDTKNKKNSDKQIDADEFDIRRDPEKTKRDIARDKVRCEKDKEMKIISEKLSLVETGLVPPGMEMEIDIEEIKKQKEKIENRSPRDLREHIKDLKGRNRSPCTRTRSPLRRRGSPPRRSPNLTLSRRRSRTPRKDALTLLRSAGSPIRRSPRISPRRSPFRRLSPKRISAPRHRSSERAFGRRRSRSHSPIYRGRRDKYSPHRHRKRSSSRESDREKWLKHRNRSRSPRRKRDEKKSFLQEIAEKLNEIRHPINIMPQLQPMQPVQPILQPMQPTLRYVEPQPLPIPVPAPVPVPPPNSGPVFPDSQQQQYDPYDQSFFIGTPQTALNSFPCQPQASPLSAGPQMPLNPISNQPINPSLIMHNRLTPNSVNVLTTPTKIERVPQKHLIRKPETQEDIGKLFQDKQISLSEFLAITAKPEVFSSSPTHLQEKIKVITRCHDAIKILEGNEKKYSGRLVVQKTNKYQASAGKYLSPLKCSPPVQFMFTNPTISVEEQKNSFTNFINGLLQKLGLLKDTVVEIDDEDMSDIPFADAEKTPNFSPPPPPLITPIKNPVSNDTSNIRYKSFLESNRFCKMVQTDVFKCEDCERRKKILYRSTAIQTSNSSATFSVSTQASEEDFQPKIPKTQSLAALTPAQLLAKSRESLNAVSRGGRVDMDNFDIHTTGYNRSNFFRGSDNYGIPRPNQPFMNSSIYEDLDPQMYEYEGGGRGRELYPPRTLDSNVRFNHNNYY